MIVSVPNKTVNRDLLHQELLNALGSLFRGVNYTGDAIEVLLPDADTLISDDLTDEQKAQIQTILANSAQQVSDIIARHDPSRLTARQQAQMNIDPYRQVVIDRIDLNPPRLQEELEAALGEVFGGFVGSGKGLVVRIRKDAPLDADNTARQIVLRHDRSQLTADQQAAVDQAQAKADFEAQLPAALAQLQAAQEKGSVSPADLSQLLNTVIGLIRNRDR